MASIVAPMLLLKWARDLLTGDSVLQAMNPAPTVSVGGVDPGTAYPRIVLDNPSSGGNANALTEYGARIWAQPRLQVTVISNSMNTDAIGAIAARIETLLDGVGSQTVTGGQVVFCN